jgi:hypothetical protein
MLTILPNSPQRSAIISFVSFLQDSADIRLVDIYLVPHHRNTAIFNCLLWPVFHPRNSILDARNWLLQGRGCPLYQSWWIFRSFRGLVCVV